MRTIAVVALVALTAVAACAKKEEPTVVELTVEPTYTGKYK